MMEVLGMTHSACPVCRSLIPAKVTTDGNDVFLQKFCPQHGESKVKVWEGPDDYLKSLRYVKPAWVPQKFYGDANAGCPDGCGFCSNHEQHLCLPILEITSRCDLDCPVCITNAGRNWDMSLDEFRHVLDMMIAAEQQVNVLNFSGGEPLVHPQILEFIDEALSRPEIIRVNISTNGRRLLREPDLADALAERNVCPSLQFDGFEERPYQMLRGENLLEEKLQVLELLEEKDLTTVIAMTLAGGANQDQLKPMLDYFFSHDHVVNLTIQPMAFAGRGEGMTGKAERVTIPEVHRLLGEAGHDAVKADDFVPLPCSHPLCFSLSFYLMLDNGRAVSLNSFVKADEMLNAISNRVFFGLRPEEHEALKRMIYDLWSGPAGVAPDSTQVMETLRGIFRQLSCGCFDARKTFTIAERRVKSIFIHAFQDAETFDLARARRCCNAYPQPDGRLMPTCAHNVFHRGRHSP